MSFPPAPFRAPPALPDWIERITVTLDHTPLAIDKGWRRERLWLLSNDLTNIEICLTAGFTRTAAGPASVVLKDPGEGTVTLDVAAAGLTPGTVVVLLRYLVGLYSPAGLAGMRPETALSACVLTVGPAGDAAVPMIDALVWPEASGQRPRVSPGGPLVTAHDGHIPLTASADGGGDFLEALSTFAATGALVPLGTATGAVDPFEFAAWPARGADGAPSIRVEDLAIEPAALIWMVRAAAPGHRGDIAVHDADRDG